MKTKLLSFFRTTGESGFIRASSIVFAGVTVVNILNYLFTLIIGRLLGPARFGEVVALSGFFIILSVPASTITAFMAKQSALHKGQSKMSSVKHLMVFLNTWSFVLGLGLLALFIILLPAIGSYLNISRTTLLVFSFLVPAGLVSAVSTGALQGLQAFKFLQYQDITSTLIKLIFAVLLVKLGFSVIGVFMALILSVLWSLFFGFWKTVQVTGPMGFFEADSGDGPSDATWASMRKIFTVVFANALLLALLSNVDVVMVKHYLSSVQAGHYGALSTLGKILLYGVAAFSTVLLPVASEAHSTGSGRGRKALWMTIGITSLAALACITLFALAPTLIIRMLFGAAYLDIAPQLGLFALAMYFVALSTIFVNYFLATHRRAFIWSFLLAVVAEMTAIAKYHASVAQITTVMVASTGFLAFLMLANYLFTPKIAYAPENSHQGFGSY